MTDTEIPLETQLNTETGPIRWAELERHFARGVVVRVDPALDLVAVAAAFVRDDEPTVMEWIKAGKVARGRIGEEQDWHQRDADRWA